jgi:hypothetical protein
LSAPLMVMTVSIFFSPRVAPAELTSVNAARSLKVGREAVSEFVPSAGENLRFLKPYRAVRRTNATA